MTPTQPPARAKSKTSHPPAGEVRLIGGVWKRSKLRVPNLPGLRPTPDRVRETLFNWLGQDLSGWRCMDVFAGTGALGFEAASRGAAQVVLCEQQPLLLAQLQATQKQLSAAMCEVRRADGVRALQQLPVGSMDLLLLDPPFDSTLFEPALRAAARALAPAGWVYLEAPVAWTDESLAALGLQRYRYLKAGTVHAHLLQARPTQAA